MSISVDTASGELRRAKGIAKCEASQSHGRGGQKRRAQSKTAEQFDETPTEMIETMRISS